jgi:hypothetical protein
MLVYMVMRVEVLRLAPESLDKRLILRLKLRTYSRRWQWGWQGVG